MKSLLRLVAAGSLVLGVASSAYAQAEVSLLVPNPFRRSLNTLIAGFEDATGYTLKVTYGGGLGTRRQVSRGEIYDVSILLPPFPEALASGNIDPDSATTLASLTLALGVREGAPKPDISTPEALRQALLAAESIALVDPSIGSDGAATREALQKLGVIDLIDSKIKFERFARATGELVTSGEADLCILYRNEMGDSGVEAVGLLPKEFATPVKVVAFISTRVRNARGARALIDYLSSPDAQALYEKDGLEPAR